jgi:hypothetical protein
MSIDKIDHHDEIRIVRGDMNVKEFVYTVGIAGDRFFRGLMDGSITISECERCGIKYLPPRLYCEECFEKIERYSVLEGEGYIYSYTVQRLDKDGSKLDRPIIWAIVRFEGVRGGLLHKIGEVDPETIYIGMMVKPVFKEKEKREGKITDILYFKPT